MADVYYFAFGANIDPAMMAAITGRTDLVGYPARLYGYRLGIQRLDQIPLNPRRILEQARGKNFRSYVLIPDANSSVFGMVWAMDREARRLVENWELVDSEVGPELAWHTRIPLDSISTIDRKVIYGLETEVIGDGQVVDETQVVDGQSYEPYLMDPEKMHQIAQRERELFFTRLGEGAPNKETL